ncbi:XrtB/PEP-CTERM-associated polysaccharide biosynthesis outer membrane protein EpsL [Pseudoduganella lutea]|uniref:Exopolysaccharide biosynthesis operon protein EpsL n=1 Tax=Pseudoduganella lutea TaxID=321985 RepID=A0A4V0Z382_9BURK|nr:XrtB/PEP-CTERM-associated polysaccharide biosynthesis outer membrane protein EpsL [Pseudoduganella lutea]QBE62533.1 hypothetical protein EWM63_05725 [Pseudoduganella lutea]
MLSKKPRLLPLAPAALAALLCCGNASAEISDTIHPFVALGYTYDDNLLRSPDNAPSEQRSDRARQAQGGILIDRPFGRQKLTGRAKVSRVTFDHYSQLDYNAKDIGADLSWQLGNRLSGNLGASYVQSLTPFTDSQSDERNLRTQRNQTATGAWRFHPSWQLRGSFVRNEFDYELLTQRINNRTDDLAEIGVDHLAASGSRIGLVARHLRGKYKSPRILSSTLIDDGYTQDELKLNVSWLYSGVTQVTVLAGYAKRKHESLAMRDSSGANGRVGVRWSPLGKVTFTADAWREFAAVESSLVTNSLNKGGSLGAIWTISAKLQATANVRHDTREFEQVPGVVFNGDGGDRINGATAGVTWTPRQSMQVSATVFRDKRAGSPLIGSSDYKANGVSINASAQF